MEEPLHKDLFYQIIQLDLLWRLYVIYFLEDILKLMGLVLDFYYFLLALAYLHLYLLGYMEFLAKQRSY